MIFLSSVSCRKRNSNLIVSTFINVYMYTYLLFALQQIIKLKLYEGFI